MLDALIFKHAVIELVFVLQPKMLKQAVKRTCIVCV